MKGQGPKAKDQRRNRSTSSKTAKRRVAPLLLPSPDSGRPFDIRRRSFLFAVRILKIAAALPATPEGTVVRNQLCRSGTSVGANVEEADGAISGPDRRRSLVIARKEAMETRYWLRIPQECWSRALDVRDDLQEAGEIVRTPSRMIQLLS